MNRTKFQNLTRCRPGFTLVELLVVIGIIALLIGLLLPTLNRARRSARSAVDLSNQRQLGQAVLTMVVDLQVTPTLTDEAIVRQVDPRKTKWGYRQRRAGESDPFNDGLALLDPASQLLPYLGDNTGTSFWESDQFSRVFLCPEDSTVPDLDDPSFPPTTGFFLPAGTHNKPVPVSYGFNADIMTNVAMDGRSYVGLSWLGVINGPNGRPYGDAGVNGVGIGQSANCRMTSVREASRTMLMADCGTIRPFDELTQGAYQDKPNLLAYMSNYMHHNQGNPQYWGTLAGKMQTGWLAWRVPLNRHEPEAINANWLDTGRAKGGAIQVLFGDGSARSVRFREAENPGEFEEVKITPWDLPVLP